MDPKGTGFYRTEGGISIHPWGSLKGGGAWGVAGGREQGGWDLGWVSKGLVGWGLGGAEGLDPRVELIGS